MSTLVFLLEHQEPAFRRLVAEAWGLPDEEASVHDPEALARRLLERPLEPVLEVLSEEARQALQELLRHGGEMPWAAFVRRYGPLRPLGPARLKREAPHRHPASSLEALWYRALVGRRLALREEEVEEVAYIPREWLSGLQAKWGTISEPEWGRPALPEEKARPQPVGTEFLDDLTTLLAGWRQGRGWSDIAPFLHHAYPPGWIQTFCQAWGLADAPLAEGAIRLHLDRVAVLLRTSEGEALLEAFQTWREAPFHDAEHLPPMEALEPLPGDPTHPRRWLLERLQAIPPGVWWSLPAFIEAVHRHAPDFAAEDPEILARWRFRRREDGRVLTWHRDGFQVAEALLRFLLTGPLHWLGVVDIAVNAFRLSPWAPALMQGRPPALDPYQGQILVRRDGVLVVPRRTPRDARYQVARAGEWLPRGTRGEYLYRWTPRSLARARAQGLSVQGLLRVLHEHAHAVPQALVRALQRWEAGEVARIETVRILRVPTAEALEALRQTPAGEDILEVLTPTLAVLRQGSEARILEALWQLGYLGEVL